MTHGRLLGLLASIGLMLTACQDRNTDDVHSAKGSAPTCSAIPRCFRR